MSAANPYLEAFRTLFPAGPSWARAEDLGLGRTRQVRAQLCKTYSWAIPTEESLSAIERYAPIVEMGAGGGYWAHLLKGRGVAVEVFDAFPRNGNCWVEAKSGSYEMLEQFSSYSLLLSWPPHNSPMAAECVKSFRGQTLIYIGEAEGGCTADDAFFEILGKEFILREKVEIPCWPGIYDAVWIYMRDQAT